MQIKCIWDLTNFKGTSLSDTRSQNYLNEQKFTNSPIIIFLGLKLQAINSRPMKMQEWIDKLDGFLLSENPHPAGKISAEMAENLTKVTYRTISKNYTATLIEMKRLGRTKKTKLQGSKTPSTSLTFCK